MKATLDHENCIGCGLCAQTCPEVFGMADDGNAQVIQPDVPAEAESTAAEAEENCPVSVIKLEK